MSKASLRRRKAMRNEVVRLKNRGHSMGPFTSMRNRNESRCVTCGGSLIQWSDGRITVGEYLTEPCTVPQNPKVESAENGVSL